VERHRRAEGPDRADLHVARQQICAARDQDVPAVVGRRAGVETAVLRIGYTAGVAGERDVAVAFGQGIRDEELEVLVLPLLETQQQRLVLVVAEVLQLVDAREGWIGPITGRSVR